LNEALYLESSALLAWLLGEPDAEVVRRAVDEAVTVVTSRLTLVEVSRGLLRAESSGRITAADGHVLAGMLAAASAGWFCLELDGSVCERAARPFPNEPVRTLDALHLASALVALELHPTMAFLTLDERLVTNAHGLGMAVFPS
jgi:predicted nucleic acid-binding protein